MSEDGAVDTPQSYPDLVAQLSKPHRLALWEALNNAMVAEDGEDWDADD